MRVTANNIPTSDPAYFPRVKKIVRLTEIDGSEDWVFYLHRHSDFCEIIYIEDGEGDYTINQTAYHVSAGDLVIINRDTGHVQRSDPRHPLHSWNLSFCLHATDSLQENQIVPDTCVPYIHNIACASEIMYCYHRLFQEGISRGPFYESSILLWAEQILLLASRLAAYSPQVADNKKQVIPSEIKQYLDDHYAEPLTLDHLSEHFFVSKYYLSHKMKEVYGVSPIDYLISRRLGEAQNLLSVTNLSVSKIAEFVGYQDVNYFIKLFRRHIGSTPTAFRQKYQHL